MKNSTLIILFFLIFASCESPKEKLVKKINQLENNDSIFSEELMQQLKLHYIDFAKKYPDDTESPTYLFKAAQRCVALNQPNEAIVLLKEIVEKYKSHNMCQNALFLMAFTYENSLNDYKNAEIIYRQFLQKYPNSELSEDATLALKNLGKKPQDIIMQNETLMP